MEQDFWTEERIAKLMHLLGGEDNLPKIGMLMHTFHFRICNKAKPTNKSSWTAERVQRLHALWAEHKTLTEIAAYFGVARSTVTNKLKNDGLFIKEEKIKKIVMPIEVVESTKVVEPTEQELPRAYHFKKHRPKTYDTYAEGEGVSFHEYDEKHHCRWPIGKLRYCGKTRVDDAYFPYCRDHRALAIKT